MIASNDGQGDWIVQFGKLFLGVPYGSSQIENPSREKLIVDWTAFDCVTFVETVLALALCARDGRVNKAGFRTCLKAIRYRSGLIDGYPSRLHYFSDWLYDNEKKGILTNITKTLGGLPRRKNIHFMTAHRELYPALKNDAAWQALRRVETRLSRRAVHVIAKARVAGIQTAIESGDIIAMATDQEGLDIAHVGFAARQGRSIRLLHASRQEGKVVLSDQTLVSYLKSHKHMSGILIARPRLNR